MRVTRWFSECSGLRGLPAEEGSCRPFFARAGVPRGRTPFNGTVAQSSQPANLSTPKHPNKLAMLTGMAALRWLTPRRQLRHGAERVGRRGLGGGGAQVRGGRRDRTENTEAALDTGTTEPEFPVHGDDRAAAFFDLDNTVMQGAAIFHFGRGLYKREVLRDPRPRPLRLAAGVAPGWPGSRTPSTSRGRPRLRAVDRQGPPRLRS